MQLSNTPDKLVLPWATSGNKNAIPVDSQIGITAGAASLTDGFPPLTMTPVAAGGVPPSGLDMNGILYEMSAVLRWANAGGGYAYDSTFANDSHVGGYPKGARVMRADGQGYWFNTVDNNTTDPEAAGSDVAGWVPDFQAGVTAIAMASSSVTLTPLQYGKHIIAITGTLTANLNLILPAIAGAWSIINGTTGAYTITAKTAAGTGVAVPQGSVSDVVGDGVNIYSSQGDLANKTDMTKGVALIGGAGRVVSSIAALKALPKTGSPTAFVLGYYNSGDGGGGAYFYDPSDTTSADNGGTIIAATDGGRWKRATHEAGKIHIRTFGAKCDGVTDDTTAFRNAIAYAKTLVIGVNYAGATIQYDGKVLISGVLTIDACNIAVEGLGNATIITNFVGTGPYAGGFWAVFVIGSGAGWASNMGSTTNRNRLKNILITRSTGSKAYGVVLSGVRYPDIENLWVELQFSALYVENCSEASFTNLFAAGCDYGYVLDGRNNRTSVLGFAYGTNDVSNNTFVELSTSYAQTAGLVLVGCRQNRFKGGYHGTWAENVTVSPPQNLPAIGAAVHIYGQGASYFSFNDFDGVIFEPGSSASRDCFYITVPSKATPINGMTFRNCYAQTYAKDFATHVLTNLVCWDIGNTNVYGAVAGVLFDTCGFYYSTGGGANAYYYPPFSRITGAGAIAGSEPGVTYRNVTPYVCLNNAQAANSRIEEKNILETVDMEAAGFPTANGWTPSASGTVTAVTGTGTQGIPKAFRCSGNAGGTVYIEKTYSGSTFRNITNRLGLIYIKFKYTGTAAPFFSFLVNGASDTDSLTVNSTNNGRYSNAIIQDTALSGVRIALFKPFSADYDFDQLRVRIGRSANANSATYTDLSLVEIGFLDVQQNRYDPVA